MDISWIRMLLVLLLSCLSGSSWGQRAPRSPCPAVFEYRLIAPGTWGGHIVVPAPDPGTPLIVTAKLLVRAILPQGQRGRLGLWYDKSLIARKIADQSVSSVDYEVLFPLQTPLPQVDEILVNNAVICQGLPVTAPAVTRVTLSHTLTPVIRPLSAQKSGEQETTPSYQTPEFEERFPSTPLPYRRRPATTPSSIMQRLGEEDEPQEECGFSTQSRRLIMRGSTIERGEWPWLAAIFSEQTMTFLCAATLVGVQHVITAAHCIQDREGILLRAHELAVVLGKHDLKRWAEPMNQAREVSAVHMPPNYDFLTLANDIAVIKLSIAATTSAVVRPICLWDSDPDLARVVGKVATVVGWGRDEITEDVRNTPLLARVPIVSQEECLRSREEFRTYTSERTLCAGFRNGTGPCSGDSGGGLVLPLPRGEDGDVRWFLRGIVSLSLSDKINLSCDLREFVVYTDVGKYIPWVRRVMLK